MKKTPKVTRRAPAKGVARVMYGVGVNAVTGAVSLSSSVKSKAKFYVLPADQYEDAVTNARNAIRRKTVEALRVGGVPEYEVLARAALAANGFIKVGKGCAIVSAQEHDQLRADLEATRKAWNEREPQLMAAEREVEQLRADLAAANKQVEELQVRLGKERDAAATNGDEDARLLDSGRIELRGCVYAGQDLRACIRAAMQREGKQP